MSLNGFGYSFLILLQKRTNKTKMFVRRTNVFFVIKDKGVVFQVQKEEKS